MLADCEVICQGKAWKLHKTILCARSSYFKSALLSGWPESKSGKVEITEFSKTQMDSIIKYIYKGTINFKPLIKAGTIMHSCTDLWILGDYFNVPALCDDILNFWSKDFIPRTDHIAMTEGFHIDGKDFLKTGNLIYASFPGKHVLKVAFLEVLLGRAFVRKSVINMPEFKTFCAEWPEFGSDCMMKLVENRVCKLQ
ncbi:BTB/POZ domain-containing protein [Colletotrichum truncatum]|uniref:BTB/POZ domain-containing protein n=1 Tax=Colletotrichum truncatum TaxID=5467 RepID=A0ACC3Z7P3_COLTU|nr:BTB/POZ domain-containing protein [Colletotrichum truncatum]KAF6782975.1 BTB/POZ domain-containing protein [Colletotrichum truncatum]